MRQSRVLTNRVEEEQSWNGMRSVVAVATMMLVQRTGYYISHDLERSRDPNLRESMVVG